MYVYPYPGYMHQLKKLVFLRSLEGRPLGALSKQTAARSIPCGVVLASLVDFWMQSNRCVTEMSGKGAEATACEVAPDHVTMVILVASHASASKICWLPVDR